MNLALAKNETGRALSDSFAIARDRLPGTGKVAEARSAAFEAYDRVGLPHRRLEDWKYTDLRALMRDVLPLAPVPDAAALTRAAAALKLQAIKGVRRLVLVDGVFAPKLSELDGLEKGLTVRTLRDVLEAGDAALQAQLFTLDNANPMVALNSAMMTDGVVIEIANGVVLKQPLHVIHIASGSAPAAMFTRSLLRLGKDAGATLVESYIAADGATAYQAHDSLIAAIGDNSRLDHVRLIEDGREAFNISSAVFTLGAHAHFNTFGMTSGAAVSRYQATIAFAGEGSTVETNGVNLLNGRQHADTTLFMDHAVPHCSSNEIFRAVAGRSRPFGVPGPHHRAPQGAEDRRQDDDAGAAAVGRGRGRQQAGTRNLRRRRHLRPWRHHRRARREPAVLPARPRPFREGSPGAADPGLRGRSHRIDRQ